MVNAVSGMGCFWGAERKFWQTSGVFSTQVNSRKYNYKQNVFQI